MKPCPVIYRHVDQFYWRTILVAGRGDSISNISALFSPIAAVFL